ncbi:putative transcription regulator protein, LysR [Novosphingobium nitrogenifigens DSM 19370]|uniref:Putative transcription regulator protein, LysR n=2 Tax=Novosphingobium nitrogenifigens TaxID=378548 RepID=F1ZBZ8_9SPHN|nr:LysR family transcriptional regulator [Novosphingobium nitrogenifigens]EGD57865.1 putative transcription regulator protein, LysR [Novosphingobium nitrogenifigens DSM 19370]
MDFHAAMQAFVAVVDEGGFAPAARRAGLAPSSLTRQIDALETHLGTILLNRSTRRVSMTAAGQAYYANAVRILDDIAAANRSVSELNGPPRGILRASLPIAFARLHVTPFIPRFMQEFPGIELEILVSDEPVSLVEQRIDVAIRLGVLPPSSLVARRLAPHRRILCASPAYLARAGVPQDPSELARHACLTFTYADGERGWIYRKDGAVERLRISGPLRANHAEALKEAAVAGMGLTLLATWMIGEELAQGYLVPVLTDWHIDIGRPAGADPLVGEPGVHALFLPDRKTSPKVRAFIDFLQARFGTPPYWDRAVGS